MTTVTFDLPENVVSALRRSPDELVKDLRLAAAIHWYHQDDLSQERAAAVAGLERIEFLDELARRRLDVVLLDIDGLRDELARG